MFYTSRKFMSVNIMSIMIQSRPRNAHSSTVSGSFAHTPSAVRPDCMHSSIGFLDAMAFAPLFCRIAGVRGSDDVAPVSKRGLEQERERESDRGLQQRERGKAR